MTTTGDTAQGKCLCGAVSFEVTPPFTMCGNCHCSICRRASGAPYVTWAVFKADQVKILSGEEQLSVFHPTSESTRRFCKTCGSQLFLEVTQMQGEILVTRATIDDAAEFKPEAHVHYSSKAPWLAVSDELPKLGGSTGLEPLE